MFAGKRIHYNYYFTSKNYTVRDVIRLKNKIQNTWVASLGICLDKFAANRAVNMVQGRSPPAVSHNMAAENVQSETRM